MNEIELEIKCFISEEISKLKPRDKEYTASFLNNELNKLTKYLVKDKVIEGIYHKYRLGIDILEILNNNKFYYDLPYEKFPMLFKVEPSVTIPVSKVKKKSERVKSKDGFSEPLSLEGMQMPPEITLIVEQIPIVKEALLMKAIEYIKIMELKSWIEKNGITKPQLNSTEDISFIEITDDVKSVLLKEKIDEHLSLFKENNEISTENYKNLVSLLMKYFIENEQVVLSKPITVSNGMTRKLAYSLGRLHKEASGDSFLKVTFFNLCTKNIAIFKKYDNDSHNFQKSNLYKYFTSNPLK